MRQAILRSLGFFLCLFCGFTAYAQNGMFITGTVLDEFGEPLPGAGVAVTTKSGTAKGTSTNITGNFKININLNDDKELVFSFVGMKIKKMKLNEKSCLTPIKVQLEPEEELLEEVTIVEDGYNKLPRKDMVGAFTTVKADDIMMPAYQSVDQMLQGKIAGVNVVNTSARVGSSPKIKIRGTSTILGNSDPLWVVDGWKSSGPL